MSTQEILAELPQLPLEERELIAQALQALASTDEPVASQPRQAGLHAGQARRPDLHPGAWEVADDFDAPLPDSFWLGKDA